MDVKFCHSCGEQIAKSAPTCPKCGAPQSGSMSHMLSSAAPRNKTVAVVLALLLGGFGVHKFYLRKHVSGVLYLIFSWTSIPVFLAIGDGLRYALIKDETFDTEFNGGQPSNKTGAALKVVGVVGVIVLAVFLVGLVAAIALPAYDDYVRKAREVSGEASTTKSAGSDFDLEPIIVGKIFMSEESDLTYQRTFFLPDHRYFNELVVRGSQGAPDNAMTEMVGTYSIKGDVLTMLRASMRTYYPGDPVVWKPITASYSRERIKQGTTSGFKTHLEYNLAEGSSGATGTQSTYRLNGDISPTQKEYIEDIDPLKFIAQGVPQEALQ